jgi:hypothetical protein
MNKKKLNKFKKSLFQGLAKLIFRHSYYFRHISYTLKHSISCLFSLFSIFGSNNFSSTLTGPTAYFIHCIYHTIIQMRNSSSTRLNSLFYSSIILVLLNLLSFLRLFERLARIFDDFLTESEQCCNLGAGES